MSDQVWNNRNIWQTICPREFVAMIVGALITTLSSHLSRVAPRHDLKHCLLLMGNRLLSWWRVSLFGEGTSLDWRREVNCMQGEIPRAWWQEFSTADAIQWGNHLHTSFISLFIILCWYCLSVTVYEISVLCHTGKSCDPRMTSAGLRRWWWTGAGSDQGVVVRGAPTLRTPFLQRGGERSRLFLTCTMTTSQEPH